LTGAAVACLSYVVYAFAKAYYANKSSTTNQYSACKPELPLVLIATLIAIFLSSLGFSLNVYVNVTFKSALISAIFALSVYFLKLSKEINTAVHNFFRLKKTPAVRQTFYISKLISFILVQNFYHLIGKKIFLVNQS
jgi:hypothetical protein